MLGNEWKNVCFHFSLCFCYFWPERLTFEWQKWQEKIISWCQNGKYDAQALGEVLKYLLMASKWAIIVSFAHSASHEHLAVVSWVKINSQCLATKPHFHLSIHVKRKSEYADTLLPVISWFFGSRWRYCVVNETLL